jgi:hypothetical protein
MGAQLRGREGAQGPRRAADGAARVMLPAGGRAAQPPWGTRLPRLRSHQVQGRGLGRLAVLSLNTTRPGVALWPGPGSHLQSAIPGAPEWRAPLRLASRPAKTRRLPPHLTQANTSKSNVLLNNPAKVHSRCPLLLRLLAGRCMGRHARLLLSCLGELRPTSLASASSVATLSLTISYRGWPSCTGNRPGTRLRRRAHSSFPGWATAPVGWPRAAPAPPCLHHGLLRALLARSLQHLYTWVASAPKPHRICFSPAKSSVQVKEFA